ncbi:MAG: SUMF1/EgtB/PvdO family nonheme iron enzyme [Treponema sp.]|nr:SUMF1/EgtB/PvdO family nonheme iron enzyme [Treponema sp.]
MRKEKLEIRLRKLKPLLAAAAFMMLAMAAGAQSKDNGSWSVSGTVHANVRPHALYGSNDAQLKYSVSGGLIKGTPKGGRKDSYSCTIARGATLSVSGSCANEDVGIRLYTFGNYDEVLKESRTKGSASVSYSIPAGVESFTVRISLPAYNNTPLVVVDCTVVKPEDMPEQEKPAEKKKEPKLASKDTKPEPKEERVDSKIRFYDLYGEVSIRPNSKGDYAYEYAELDTIIYEDDRIKTEEDSGAILGLEDMSTYVIKPESILIIQTKKNDESLLKRNMRLLGGAIWSNLKRMGEDRTLDVEMSQCIAGIKGTIFALEDDGKTSRVYTLAGEVEVTSKKTGKKQSVKSGQIASVGTNGAIKMQEFDIEQGARKFGIPMDDIIHHYEAGYVPIASKGFDAINTALASSAGGKATARPSQSGNLLTNGDAEDGLPLDDEEHRKKRQYKMYFKKDFGDTISKGGTAVKVYACIAEIGESGNRIPRPDLTARIQCFSGDGTLAVTDGGMSADGYRTALVSVPEECATETGTVSFKSWDDDGNSLTRHIVFRIEEPEIEFGQENIAIPHDYQKPLKSSATPSKAAPAGFVYIPAGSFMMGMNAGSSGARDNESPAHKVTLTRDFYMCDHEVTQKEYKELFRSLPGILKHKYGRGDDYPIHSVNWYAAIAYCNKRSAMEGLTPCYMVRGVSDWANIRSSDIPAEPDADWNAVSCDWDADGYRLPTEAEWEYAARAGSSNVSSATYIGSGSAGQFKDYGWYGSNSYDMTHEVKLKKPNAWGLYDMGGNVFEMVWDRYDLYSSASVINPTGSGWQQQRVSRGGDFHFGTEKCTVSYREGTEPTKASANQGFRVCRTVRVTGQ